MKVNVVELILREKYWGRFWYWLAIKSDSTLANSREEEIADDNTQVQDIELQETEKVENVQNNYEVQSGSTFSESSEKETQPPENSNITPIPAKRACRVRTYAGGRVWHATGVHMDMVKYVNKGGGRMHAAARGAQQ